jgi:thiamine kinase-like enzyme
VSFAKRWVPRAESLVSLLGGASNRLFRVVDCDGSPLAVLRELSDASDGISRALEERMLAIASSARIAPAVLAKQSPYRLEEWLPGRALARADFTQEAVQLQVIDLLCSIHHIQADGLAREDSDPDVFLRLREFAEAVDGIAVPPMHLPTFSPADGANWKEVVDAVVSRFGSGSHGAPVVVHADVNAGNVISDGAALKLIDFEYSAWGPAEWDLCNFFAEIPMDNNDSAATLSPPDASGAVPVGFSFRPHQRPSTALLVLHYCGGDEVMAAHVGEVCAELEPAVHLTWGLWALLQAFKRGRTLDGAGLELDAEGKPAEWSYFRYGQVRMWQCWSAWTGSPLAAWLC